MSKKPARVQKVYNVSMICVVKPIEEKDVKSISKLISNALEADFPYKKDTVKAYQKMFGEAYFAKIFSEKKNCILGAFDNDKLIGAVVIKPDIGGVAYVDWLVVGNAYRGAGVGSALLSEMESWLLNNKYHYVYLFTETDKNIKFYEKRGFIYVGKYEGAWFGETEHTLGKKLKDEPFPEVFDF